MSRSGVAVIVLAAGATTRLGRPIQLLPFRGTTLLRAVALEACASSCDRVAIVLGADAPAIAPTLRGLGVTLILDPRWREGIAASIRRAIEWASRRHDAAVLMVADQPRLTAAHIDRLIETYRVRGGVVASRYRGEVGVPAIFGRGQFPYLLALTGDPEARAVIGLVDATALDWSDGGALGTTNAAPAP